MTSEPTKKSLISNVLRYYRAKTQVILSGLRQAQITKRPEEQGRIMEGILYELLQELLPQRFLLSSGQIQEPRIKIDKTFEEGKRTPQLDIIVLDRYFSQPLMSFGSKFTIWPSECALGAIEVKSTLSNTELRKIRKDCAICKKLNRGGVKHPKLAKKCYKKLIYVVVALRSKIEITKLKESVEEWKYKPDIIAFLADEEYRSESGAYMVRKGIIRLPHPLPKGHYNYSKGPDVLFPALECIVELLNRVYTMPMPPSLLNYYTPELKK